MHLNAIPATLAAFVSLTASAAASDWVVSQADPGADFTSIQAAIDAAADGDTIRILDGVYPESLHIQAKGLRLINKRESTTIAFTASNKHQGPMLIVEDLEPDQEVVVEELYFLNNTYSFGVACPAVVLRNNAGKLRFQNLYANWRFGPAVVATNCAELEFFDGFFVSRWPTPDASGALESAPGMVLEQGTNAKLWDVIARGARPLEYPGPTPFLPGGDGVVVDDSTVEVVAPDFRGGGGTNEVQAGCLVATSGGAGLRVLSTTGGMPSVKRQGGIIHAGPLVAYDACATPPDHPFGGLAGLVSAVVPLTAGAPRHLELWHYDSIDKLFTIVWGAEGDLYWLFASGQEVAPVPLAGVFGEILIDPTTAFVIAKGMLPGGAAFERTEFDLQPLPQFDLRLQAFVFGLDQSRWLTNMMAVDNH